MPSRPVGLLLAEGVAIDQLTSRITIFNSLGFIFTQAIPARLHRLVVVVVYELDHEPDPFRERVEILAPNGEIIAEAETVVEAIGRSAFLGETAHHSIHMMWNLLFPSTGDYRVRVLRGAVDGTGEWTPAIARALGVGAAPHPMFPAHGTSS